MRTRKRILEEREIILLDEPWLVELILHGAIRTYFFCLRIHFNASNIRSHYPLRGKA